MMQPYGPESDFEQRLSRKLLDVFIRAAIAIALAIFCYRIFAPFVGLIAWSIILAVTLYPVHQKLARNMKGKQGLAATVLVVAGLVLIGVPTAILMGALGDSLQNVVTSIRAGTFMLPSRMLVTTFWSESPSAPIRIAVGTPISTRPATTS
ncbi:MAG: AI-2E family transporter, partial [Massilia sp.]